MEKNNEIKRVAWVHNFNREVNPSSGIFMYILHDKCNVKEVDIQLYYVSPSFNPIKFVKQIIDIRRKLKGYDYIHAQYGSATGFLTLFAKGKKILTLRGSDLFKTKVIGLKAKLHITIGNFLTRLSVKFTDNIVVMSDHMKNMVSGINRRAEISVIPDGIDLTKFKEDDLIGRKEPFRVLFSSVAEYNPVKRYQLAKEAFDKFNKRVEESELVIMTGVTHDMVVEFINSVDVVLLTSTHEGWPNIIKECLACNIPFVSTNVSDLEYIANKTKKCFVTGDSSDEISDALLDVWKQKDNKEDLRKYVLDMDIDVIANRIIELYK